MAAQKLLLMGASTGGPGHFSKLIPSLGTQATVIIAQHMQESFINSFCHQLSARTTLKFQKVQPELPLRKGQIAITHGDLTCLKLTGGELILARHREHSIYRPCVDALFETAALLTDRFDIMAVLLTGIGSDGARGLLRLRQSGAATIAEAEESAIVYGMPKAAQELGAAQEILPLEQIAERIGRFSHDL